MSDAPHVPIAFDSSGAAAPPRLNGELVFEAPWEGRAFGLCVAVLEREELEWDDFRPALIRRIDEEPGRPYYENLVLALEDFTAERGIR